MGKSNAPSTLQRRKDRMEEWMSARKQNSVTKLADWELDEAYLALVMATYPLDMEEARMERYTAQSARSRLRTRYEGFCLLRDARAQVQALADAAAIALEAFAGTEDPA